MLAISICAGMILVAVWVGHGSAAGWQRPNRQTPAPPRSPTRERGTSIASHPSPTRERGTSIASHPSPTRERGTSIASHPSERGTSIASHPSPTRERGTSVPSHRSPTRERRTSVPSHRSPTRERGTSVPSHRSPTRERGTTSYPSTSLADQPIYANQPASFRRPLQAAKENREPAPSYTASASGNYPSTGQRRYYVRPITGPTGPCRLLPAANRIIESPRRPQYTSPKPVRHPERTASSPPHQPFWQAAIQQPILFRRPPQPLSIERLALDTLEHSLQLKVVADQTRVERAGITEADAAFDWVAFANASWADITRATGSRFEQSGNGQLQNHALTYEAGVRRTNTFGGEVSLSSEIGTENSSSPNFQPPKQGHARLTLNYTQPLLRGAGQYYNRSTIILAEIATSTAESDYLTELQDQLAQIHASYWELYFARASLVTQRRLLQQAEKLVKQLEARQNVDGGKDQLLRARSTAAVRRAALLRAEQAILDSQANLRNLANSPRLFEFSRSEFLPQDVPSSHLVPISAEAVLQQALTNRPELLSAMNDIKAASVRTDVSKNELLPSLNLVVESYLNGLRGNYDISGAFDDQFQEGRPSYTVGLELETPFRRRAARANMYRSTIELRQMQNRFQLAVEQVWIEVDRAVRELRTSYREIEANRIAMQEAAEALAYKEKRWVHIPPNGQSTSLILEDLLNFQDRLSDTELAYLRSQIAYANAMVQIRRVTGTLLSCDRAP